MDFTKIKDNLTARGFEVTCFEKAEEAAKYLNERIDGVSVGFGGSVTLRDMGMYESLSAHNDVYWQWYLNGQDKGEVIKAANSADVFLSSVNAISEDGDIINIDGTCNRIAGMVYGHKKVYFVIGKNKIAEDYDKAMFRARNVAGPLNAQRLNSKTPCAAKADKCYNCKSPERICRALSVIWEKPTSGDFEVILVNEDLGF